MFSLKYYDDYKKIRAAQRTATHAAISAFDFEQLGADSWWQRIKSRLTAWLFRASFWFFRAVWPIPRLGRLVAVSRAADVRFVLDHPEWFEVPYGLEMTELAGGENFVLGMEGPGHDEQRKIITEVVHPDDPKLVAALSRQFALALIKSSGGRIDVMKDLITRVASETCSRYFGLKIDDPDAFAEWTMSLSALLFVDPGGDASTRSTALSGAERLRAVIDRSIRKSRNNGQPAQNTLLGRLLAARAKHPDLSDERMRAILVGLATGLIPTNTLAAGKILQELLRCPDALDAATKAARAAEQFERSGADGANTHKQRLEAILFEAARLNPALAPGQWRYAREDGVILSPGGRTTRIAKGSVLMVATMSALRDKAAIDRPGTFDPDRKRSDIDLLFGAAVHECLGKYLAIAQITEIFQVLLAQDNLRVANDRWGKMRWTGPIPTRLDMEFDCGTGITTQEMLTICAPLKPGSSKEAVKELIENLEKSGALKTSLDATGIVHFASLSVIEAGDEEESKPHLLLELNVDGTRETAIRTVATCTQAQLGKIFDHAPLGGARLAETFSNYALDLKTRPWGATGLNFNGTPEFPVADIKVQQDLAVFTRKALTTFIEANFGIGSRALPAVRFIRALIRQDPACFEMIENESDRAKYKKEIAALMEEGAQFEDFLVLPGRKRLLISEWTERTGEDAISHFLKSWDFLRLAIPLLVIAALLSIGIHAAFDLTDWFGRLSQILISITGGVVSTAMLAVFIAAAFVLLLRWHERTDVPDNRDPTLSDIRTVTARENLPGYAQNHFMAVTLLKPGWFRKLTLALSLWGIKQLVRHAYRPGFVLNMGTIHYAKWFRLPKTDKLIFLSNFDGSWESYLEDFIMKAHAGQTAAWSNGVGFPKTRLLIYEGAEDGDRFKRWVRRQQVPAQFWYSRFPELTTDQIRNNAVIHQGLVRAHSDTAAISWLDCFGSMQRPDHAIETEEVQSLMFRGFKRYRHAAYALLKFPDDAKLRSDWLEALLPGKILQDGSRAPNVSKQALGSQKMDTANGDRASDAFTPDADLTKLSFGEHPFRRDGCRLATFVAFSGAGLKKLGLPSGGGDGGLAGFDSAFSIGMANRARILGDDARQKWRWSDGRRAAAAGDESDDVPTVDAVLIVFSGDLNPEDPCVVSGGSNSKGLCEVALAAHRKLLGDDAFIDEIYSEPVDKDVNDEAFVFKEHFGFRDGISQPVIRGTHRLVEGALDRDIVEPGEFILGYRNNQGYYPPAVRVSAATDLNDRLPDVIADSPPRFPSFRTAYDGARDFGRNGTYLVVRQIQQHVERFESFTDKAAKKYSTAGNRLSNVVGSEITKEWVAAKMMGRWRNGVPLALRPGNDGGKHLKPSDMAANDFAYARDDPQGLRCPFGAHIRRANPRDGLRPGDDLQQAITNRHRLLRRGRTYEIPANSAAAGHDVTAETEKGIVFTCLCADLERQFEFVQQTWIASSSFHGLTGEVDPIIGSPDPGKTAVFTIPTPSGPITLDGLQSFVTVRAGGYFFMPSYSAICYLWDRSREEAGSGR